MTKEILERIDTKLDIMIRLLAIKAVEGRSKTDAILELGALGLESDLIAKIVVTTPAAVRARLSEARKIGKNVSGKSKSGDKKVTEEAV